MQPGLRRTPAQRIRRNIRARKHLQRMNRSTSCCPVRDSLLARMNIGDSYPHCWRCHDPVISVRPNSGLSAWKRRWKIRMARRRHFAERALDEIKKVRWDPSWGEERIANMIATRPDWCISRQRIWGVPIAVFLCETCHQPLKDPAICSDKALSPGCRTPPARLRLPRREGAAQTAAGGARSRCSAFQAGRCSSCRRSALPPGGDGRGSPRQRADTNQLPGPK